MIFLWFGYGCNSITMSIIITWIPGFLQLGVQRQWSWHPRDIDLTPLPASSRPKTRLLDHLSTTDAGTLDHSPTTEVWHHFVITSHHSKSPCYYPPYLFSYRLHFSKAFHVDLKKHSCKYNYVLSRFLGQKHLYKPQYQGFKIYLVVNVPGIEVVKISVFDRFESDLIL